MLLKVASSRCLSVGYSVGEIKHTVDIASLSDRLADNEKGFRIQQPPAVEGVQLEVLNWFRRHHIAWSADTRRAAWMLGYELYD
jgi:hypothetical protein